MAQNKNRENINDNNTGEALGTVGGAGVGAAAGSFFGPLGTIAGAVIGGAAGNKAGDQVDNATTTDSDEQNE